MADVKQSGTITAIIGLDEAKDADTHERLLVLTVLFEDDTIVRMPMTAEVAGRVFGLLAAVHGKQPLPLPDAPIIEDTTH